MHFYYKILLCTLIFISLLCTQSLFIFNNKTNTDEANNDSTPAFPENTIQCYRMNLDTLPDISLTAPRKDKSIFFHETSCNSFDKGKITINARQACAVESAASLNPNLDVYLLYSSPGIFKFQGDESDKFFRALLSYDNVNILYLDYYKYTNGTPVEELYKSGKLESSDYVVYHASDIIRLTTLWKYGGIYLDLDIIVTKPLTELPLNFAGIERKDSVASGVLSFASNGIGHSVVEKCLNELKNNFDGEEWAKNGPGLITRVLQETCGVTLAKDMIGRNCDGFTVYPQNMFYSIPGFSWRTLFDEKHLKDIINATKTSYTIHFWNDVSAAKKISVKSIDTPYLYFARKFCPKVAKAVDKYF